MAARTQHDERNQDATIYIGGIDEKVTDSLIWELMLQVGPVGYGFCEFQTEEDADYAVKIMNQIKIFGRPIRVNKASADKRTVINVGADIHVSGLDPSIDERALLNIFSVFGPLMAPPRLSRDEKGQSRGYATISFTDFVASDAAIEAMNGQYLGGRPITLSYAFKKDGQKGERHGSTAERRLADMGKKNNYIVTGLPMNAIPALPPPLPQGFMQAANAPPGAAPPGAPPVGPTPVPGQYLAPTPAGPPPGFSGAAIPGQSPPGFGPPPGMPPPPTGF